MSEDSDKMSKEKEDMSFEEAYSLLKREADNIASDSVTLEAAMESYRRGREYYEICAGRLEEAKQLIQIYDKENDTLKEM